MNHSEWVQLRDDAGEPARLRERDKLESALKKAERLIDVELYTTDDLNTGIIYKHGEGASERRVSVEVYMMMLALTRGVGMGAKWQREKNQPK